MSVEQQNTVEQGQLPKNAPHQKALQSVSWSPMDDSSSPKVASKMLPPPWPFWAGMSMNDALSFYEDAITRAADSGGQEKVNYMRRHLAENDLFYLMVFILQRKDMLHPWIYARCRDFQKEPNGHIDLWAREHYKSTIITFGGLIFEIIRNPEVTIGIFSQDKPTAKAFLRQIKYEFETREAFLELWPDIFWENPQRQSPKWSEDEGLVVKRKSNPKEATLEAHGLVDGMPTGRHFILRNYDDVVVPKSVNTPEQIIKTTTAWELSDNLGTEGGVERYIGTRYHLFDTYAEMIKRGVVKVRKFPATHDGTETGRPVLMSEETIRHKRKLQGPYTFGSQMLLNPLADSAMGFKQPWLRDHLAEVRYDQAISSLARIIVVDPSSGKSRDAGTKKNPNGNDYTSMWVLGLSADEHWYVLEFFRDRLSLTQRTAALFALHRRWRPQKVGYEEYGMQADIEHIEYVQEKEVYRFPIIPLGGQMSKPNRIRRLVPYFENGLVHLPPSMTYKDHAGMVFDMVRVFEEEEFIPFPVLAHDDMLDSLSRFIDEEMHVDPPAKRDIIQAKGFDLDAALHQHSFNNGYTSSIADDAGWMTA